MNELIHVMQNKLIHVMHEQMDACNAIMIFLVHGWSFKSFSLIKSWVQNWVPTHTPKPQIQSVKPRKGRLGTKAISCSLWCVYGVFVGVFFCLEERKKRVERLGRRQISGKKKCALPICGVLRAIYSLGRIFRGGGPQGPLASKGPKWMETNTHGKIMTSCFWKCMDF